jgi:cell division protein FtsB
MSDMKNNRSSYKKNYISYSEYVEGNAVRKTNVQELPAREPRTYVGHERISSKSLYKNREKALRMSAGYVAVLAVCCGLMAGVCAKYLSLRDEITSKKAEIATLELNVEALKAQNDSTDYNINSYMDIENIAKVATEELGMVQAGKEQITFYNKSESEYMKQYNEVPSK